MATVKSADDLILTAASLVGEALTRTEETFENELSTGGPYVADIITHTRRFRGKRLRPLLCLLTAKALGNLNRNHEILAAVVEMIHTATLVHDDVLDEAEVRRHVATVNVRWNNETSVLYGDYLFTHAFHLAASTGSAEACRLIGHATNRVCEGELMQVRNRGNLEITEQDYFTIIDGKTAELCAVSCLIGAKFAGASESINASLERFGRSLGMAFQIADDILDLTASQQLTGKTLGTDLGQKKLTLPLIRCLNSVSPAERDQLVAWIHAGTSESTTKVLDLVVSSGAMSSATETAQQFTADARRELKSLPPSPAKTVLEKLPAMSIARQC
ncbi:MAG: polyprenyl synthetase family protein [Planctomycetaceae bacterium]|nr:polyprenyl synthetase family protein [Planctomycetaceae bacterium]